MAEDQLIYKCVIYHTKFKVASLWFAPYWPQDHAIVLNWLLAYILTFNEISCKTYTAINLQVLSCVCQWSQQMIQYDDDSDYWWW